MEGTVRIRIRRVCFVQFARWRHWGDVCRLRLHLAVKYVQSHYQHLTGVFLA